MNIGDLIVDGVLVVILLVGFIWGIKAGFIKTVAKPVKFVLALIISLSFASWVAEAFVQPLLAAPIVDRLTVFFTEHISSATDGTDLPTIINLAATLAGVDLGALGEAATQEEVIAEVVNAITQPVVSIITSVIGFIALYIVSSIILTILFAILEAIVDNGVVGILNRVLGCILLTILAGGVCWCLCAISDLILGLPILAEQEWVQGFQGGIIYNFFKGLNPIDLIMNLILRF